MKLKHYLLMTALSVLISGLPAPVYAEEETTETTEETSEIVSPEETNESEQNKEAADEPLPETGEALNEESSEEVPEAEAESTGSIAEEEMLPDTETESVDLPEEEVIETELTDEAEEEIAEEVKPAEESEEQIVDAVSVQEKTQTASGYVFVTRGGKTYLYQNGQKQIGLWMINGNMYFFDTSGVMQKGWVYFKSYPDGYWNYYNSDGTAAKGWKKLNGSWYHFDEMSYCMDTGLIKINGKTYGFAQSGRMLTGWQKFSDKWYFFTSGGAAKTGWLKWNNKWYYMNSSGVMVKYKKTIGGKIYYFNGNGVMQKGWKNLKGKWYYFTSSGAAHKGWLKWKGKWYYMNSSCVMVKYKKTIGGKIYYFNGNGVMQTGWKKLNGKWYYFDSNGAAHKGWLKLNNKWYYLNSSGIMVTGTQTIGGKVYHFNSSGVWISNTSIPTVFNSYYEVIQAYQNKYGKAQLVNNNYTGLWYAELVDFDGWDGPELVIGVNSSGYNDVFVFGHVSGKVRQIAHPKIAGAEGGYPDGIWYFRDTKWGDIYLYGYDNLVKGSDGRYYSVEYLYGFYAEDHQRVFIKLKETWRDKQTGRATTKVDYSVGNTERIGMYFNSRKWFESTYLNGEYKLYDLDLLNSTIARVKNMQ